MTRHYEVELETVTLSVTVEAEDDDDALEQGRESLRQALENDLRDDNLVVSIAVLRQKRPS